MKSTPAYILRDCAFWANEDLKLGQVSEMALNLPREKNESFRNAGMVKDRKTPMGYEIDDLEFGMSAFDPATLLLATGKPGSEHSFMATGALVDEDGTTHSAVYSVRGRLITPDAGTWKPGDSAELKCMVVQNYAKLEIDQQEIFEIDDFDYVLGGVSQRADIRSALLLT